MSIRYSDYDTSRQKQWSLDDFELLHRIGRGKFGEVYGAKDKTSDFIVAIKIMSKDELIENNYIEQVKRQVIIQSILKHPNIIKLYGYFSSPTAFSLILEYAPRGELFSIMKRMGTFNELQVSKIIKQVCQGLSYLHANNVIHRDIKPQNILIAGDTVKIADFGWAIYSQKKRQTFCGTLDYLSPQMLQGSSHDFKVDIWALGVLTYELAVGRTPFEDNSRAETINKIVAESITFPSYLSPDFKKFVRRCLQKDPAKRPTAYTLLHDTYLQKYQDQKLILQ